MTKFSNFFKCLKEYGNKMIEKSKKALDDLILEIQKDKFEGTINFSLNEFIQTTKNFLLEEEKLFDKIGKELNEKIDNKIELLNIKNNDLLNELKQLESILLNLKNKLEQSKYDYFESSKTKYEQEEKFDKFFSTTINSNISDNFYTQLVKAQKNCESITDNYKTNVENMNIILHKYETNYTEIFNSLKLQEETKIVFVTNIINNFNEIIREKTNNEKNYNNKIDKIITSINVKNDVRKYEKLMSFLNNNGKRFSEEQFLNYELYRKKLSNNNSSTNNKILNSLLLTANDKILGFSCGTHYDNFEIRKLQLKEFEEKNTKVSNIIKIIFSSVTLGTDDLMYVINFIEGNKNNSMYVMKELSVYYEKTILITLSSIENLHHLSNILLIIMNNVQIFKEIFDLNYVIIYMAEMTLYRDPNNFDNKFYLCDLISNNKMFSFNEFWDECINKKIEIISEIKVKNEIEKSKNMEIKKKKSNQDMFSKVKNMLGNKFNNNQHDENKKIEDKIIYEKMYEEKIPVYAVEILEDYINHFFNFNYNIKEGEKIIINIGKKYKISNKYINYFETILFSNYCSRKYKHLNSNKEKNVKSTYFKIKKFKNLSNKSILLFNIIRFIPIKEITPLIYPNKEIYNNLKKYIYKNILFHYQDIDVKTHIQIWKILINHSEMKKKYNYKKIKEDIKNNPNSIPSGEVIDLDILRTAFEKDKNENREKIRFILKAISKESQDIKYCQGMNYVASFIIHLMNDEEEIFYFLISLFNNTNYGKLFLNDFSKLKKYFYFFERLLNIYLPEVYLYFINYNINVSFFISSWFITIFTNSYTKKNYGKEPKILMKIWDLLLIKGIKSFLIIGLSMIKYFENKLLSLGFEKLLRFLITDILESEFFINENYDKALKIIMDFKFPKELMDNLEKEYEIKLKIPQLNEKN